MGLNRCDILHFYNTISFGKTPWVTTFESTVPRYASVALLPHREEHAFAQLRGDRWVRRALEAMCGDSCVKLIAMSECNRRMQEALFTCFPEYSAALSDKLTQMHPPQAPIVGSWGDKHVDLDGRLELMFVGAQFFRKGGKEILEVLSALKRDEGCDLGLTVVSTLDWSDWASGATEADAHKARAFMEANADWITYFPRLPNDEVIRRMCRAHIGLFPTYADTYGYTMLEFQACGCPIVTTDVRATTEVNDNRVGWVIPVRRNVFGEAYYATAEERAELSETIRKVLRSTIRDAYDNRDQIPEKADAGLERVREVHSPDAYSSRMWELYTGALEDVR